MKNLFLIIFVAASFLSGKANVPLGDHVDWDYEKVPLKDILEDIEAAHKITFSYGNIKLNTNVTIQYEGPLEEGLKQLFEPENIVFKVIGDQIVLRYGDVKGKDIKGRIMDGSAGYSLIGATIIVVDSDPLIGTTTDMEGYFRLSELTVGRYDLRIDYIGFESRTISQVLVSTGKEVFLNIDMEESALELAEIVVTAEVDKSKPMNEMATLSARTFTVEETKRYAAAVSDPARMALSFAGVGSGGDDLENEIIIRGNSARGLLWRLEGINIPSPNHFGSLGSGGGGISMLSASTLSNSDFYTGAFPPEYGNALSGVFDLQMRNGNTDDYEHSIMFGNLGLEVSTEGPFKKGSNASYLFNYRFSTLGFMGKFLNSLDGVIPTYQDLSFKINVPTENAGVFAIFGLGGINEDTEDAIMDSTLWNTFGDRTDYFDRTRQGTLGLTHKYLFGNNKTWMRTSVAGTAYTYEDLTNYYLSGDNSSEFEAVPVDETNFNDYTITASMQVNHKAGARHHIKAGLMFNTNIFNYDYRSTEENIYDWISFFKNDGSANYLETFLQWKFRMGEDWTLNAGVNASHLFLNNTWGIDPRIGIKWNFKENQSLALAAGLHSKPEHTSTYFIERITDDVVESPNMDLDMPKAVHVVLAYDWSFKKDFRLKAEAYYQYLYDVPVSINQSSGYSILNSHGVFDVIFANDANGGELVSEGTGVNYGIDITLEKFFSKGYYFLITGSVFDSKYSTLNNEYFHSSYASNYIANALAGKEWMVGKKKKNLFVINGKFNYYDGNRITPIDVAASREAGTTIQLQDTYYTEKVKPYYRFDVGIAYTINAPRSTHSILFDVQNLTNRLNIYDIYYDPYVDDVVEITQNGAVPIFNYRVEF